MKATNGTDCQTITSAATAKNDSGLISHEWPWASIPSRPSRKFTTPYWLSNIQPQITIDVSAGIAQASSRPTLTARRIPLDNRPIMSAMSVPRVMVSTTQAAQNSALRSSTCQNAVSPSTAR
ncbi:hypothetical protein GCM10025868_44120 [Angustibacter aerolatus]|uniref:Uncharacterized protein n=1 Tax=Angustibacter aerolatus TaxID=1162965 RepID=A0ABQ6JQR3_9ACTN|nr:hypothetical protein GCM10025868_44120 [Angustibacter aerolatus]